MQNKTLLRQQLRALRRQLSPKAQAQAALRLAQRLKKLPELRHAHHISAYWPNDGEINPLPGLKQLQTQHIYLPIVLNSGHLAFRHTRLHAKMSKNQFGIPEPRGGTRRNAQQLDIIFLPLVGFDTKGNRLGMGGGFYDKTLAFKKNATWRKKPLLIGLAHQCQQVNTLEQQCWDIPLDMLISDQQTLRFRSKRF